MHAEYSATKVETAEVVCATFEKLFLLAGSPRVIKDAMVKAMRDTSNAVFAKAATALRDLRDAAAHDVVMMSRIAEVEAWTVVGRGPRCVRA